jgi:cell division inhibitor SepF
MAGAVRRMAVYLGLVEDDSYNEDYSAEASEPRSSQRSGARRGFSETYEYEEVAAGRSVRPIQEPRGVRTIRRDEELPTRGRVPEYNPPARQIDFAKIETIHPRSYNDARRIGEEYRDGIPVIMNLGDLDDSDAKRIIDFAAGLVFGCRGSIERITNKVFLLSPVNVDVGDQARQQLAQDGFFNQS